MRLAHYLTAAGVAGVIAVALTIPPAGHLGQGPTGGSPVAGIGGAGGPLAGIGGAGAFIPPAHVNGPFGAGGPLAGIGGAGAFIPSAQLVASIQRRLVECQWSPQSSLARCPGDISGQVEGATPSQNGLRTARPPSVRKMPVRERATC